MTGTLELLCGPSGVGKTSSLESAVKSYRWTTRPRREREIDSREYDGTQTTHGFFVSEEEFLQRSDLVGVHRYPNPKTGEWYGFPREDITDALNRGEKVIEQVVDIEAVRELSRVFRHRILKKLYLSDVFEHKKRVRDRDSDESRFSIEIIEKYLAAAREGQFDQLFFTQPTTRSISGDELIRLLDDPSNTEYDLYSGHISEILHEKDPEKRARMVDSLKLLYGGFDEVELIRSYPSQGKTKKDYWRRIAIATSGVEYKFISVPLSYCILLRDLGKDKEADTNWARLSKAFDEVDKGRLPQTDFIDYGVTYLLYWDVRDKSDELRRKVAGGEFQGIIGFADPNNVIGMRQITGMRLLAGINDVWKNLVEPGVEISDDEFRLLVTGYESVVESYAAIISANLDRFGPFLSSVSQTRKKAEEEDLWSQDPSLMGSFKDDFVHSLPLMLAQLDILQTTYLNLFSLLQLGDHHENAELHRSLQFTSVSIMNSLAETVIFPTLEGRISKGLAKYLAFYVANFSHGIYNLTTNFTGMPLVYPSIGSPEEIVGEYHFREFPSFDISCALFFGTYATNAFLAENFDRSIRVPAGMKPPKEATKKVYDEIIAKAERYDRKLEELLIRKNNGNT